jgi:uncharacterized membrane protein YgaE (UPF0421/DUF939 family)
MLDLEKYRVKPKIGLRTIKTALAAALCAFIYFFLDRNPAFACIGAIFGMGSNFENSIRDGGNRAIGTTIGGFIGILMYSIYLVFHPEGGYHMLLAPLLFVGVILLIICCQRFWVGGIQPGGVVLCILLFNMTADTYVSYALNRMLDTFIGVVMAIIVNLIFPGGFGPLSDREQSKQAADEAVEEVLADLAEGKKMAEEYKNSLKKDKDETKEE